MNTDVENLAEFLEQSGPSEDNLMRIRELLAQGHANDCSEHNSALDIALLYLPYFSEGTPRGLFYRQAALAIHEAGGQCCHQENRATLSQQVLGTVEKAPRAHP